MKQSIKNLKFNIVNSINSSYVEIVATFLMNGVLTHHYIFITKHKGRTESDYLKEAKEIFERDLKNHRVGKTRRGATPVLATLTAVFGAAALALGGFLVYKYVGPGGGGGDTPTGGGGEIKPECEEGLSFTDSEGNPVTDIPYKPGDTFTWNLNIDEDKTDEGFHIPHDPNITIDGVRVPSDYYEYDSDTGELIFTIPEGTTGEIKVEPKLSKDFASLTYHQLDNEYCEAMLLIKFKADILKTPEENEFTIDWGDGEKELLNVTTDDDFQSAYDFTHIYKLDVGEEAIISLSHTKGTKVTPVSISLDAYFGEYSVTGGTIPADFEHNANISAISLYSPLEQFVACGFAGTNIKSITIPSTIALKGSVQNPDNIWGIFSYCPNLKTIKLSKDVPEGIAPNQFNYNVIDGVLYEVKGGKGTDYSLYVINAEPGFEIKDETWQKINDIRWNAFTYHNELTEFTIPASANSSLNISDGAFAFCPNLVDFNIANPERDFYISPDGHTLVSWDTGVARYKILTCTGKTDFEEIEEKIGGKTSYYLRDYCGCGNDIKNVIITNSLYTNAGYPAIGNYAFAYCPNLEKVENKRTTELDLKIMLGDGILSNCPNLVSVDLPKIASFRNSIFNSNLCSNCPKLKTLTIAESNDEYKVVTNEDGIKMLVYVDSDNSAYHIVTAINENNSRCSFKINDSNYSICFSSNRIFTNPTLIKEIHFPSNFTKHDYGLNLALMDCVNLEKFTVDLSSTAFKTSEDGRLLISTPSGSNGVGRVVLTAMSGYTNSIYEINDSIIGIECNAFRFCKSLETIKVNKLGFAGAKKDTEINFGIMQYMSYTQYNSITAYTCPYFKYFDLSSITDSSFFNTYKFVISDASGKGFPEGTIIKVANGMKNYFKDPFEVYGYTVEEVKA